MPRAFPYPYNASMASSASAYDPSLIHPAPDSPLLSHTNAVRDVLPSHSRIALPPCTDMLRYEIAGKPTKTVRKRKREKPAKKGPWTKEENDLLRRLVKEYGPKRWREIAYSIPGRTGKQARERWMNQLCPDIKVDSKWTEDEDRMIILRHYQYGGNKWSKIANWLPGRTDNHVKNRFNSTLKKRRDEGHYDEWLKMHGFELGRWKLQSWGQEMLSPMSPSSGIYRAESPAERMVGCPMSLGPSPSLYTARNPCESSAVNGVHQAQWATGRARIQQRPASEAYAPTHPAGIRAAEQNSSSEYESAFTHTPDGGQSQTQSPNYVTHCSRPGSPGCEARPKSSSGLHGMQGNMLPSFQECFSEFSTEPSDQSLGRIKVDDLCC